VIHFDISLVDRIGFTTFIAWELLTPSLRKVNSRILLGETRSTTSQALPILHAFC
jgi:hypothetical protein